MKIAATVIVYYPDGRLLQNMQSYINAVEKLYIVDNSEKPIPELFKSIDKFQNVVYLHDGENKGIALRLNQVSNMAIKDGFGWLLTMDQDSLFENETVRDYLHCIANYQQKEKVSIFGINFLQKANKKDNCTAIQVNHLITSGSVLNLQLFGNVGGFDENLFIDEVDFEYCLRSTLKGFRIIQFTNIFLQHNLGTTSAYRSFKSGKMTPRSLHSPIRIYYMTRNFLYVQSKYKKLFSAEIKTRKIFLFNRLKNNLIYNTQRFEILKYIIKGFEAYKNKQMGKLK